MPDDSAARLRRKPLWRNFSFSLMWTSTAASGFGDRSIMLVALALLGGVAASGADNSTSVQASTQFFFFLPYLVFSLIGGWLADRLPRKWIMLGCDELRGVVLLLSWFSLLGATGPAELDAATHWRVFVSLAIVGAAAAVFHPARSAVIPQIIPPEQLQAANGVILVINVVASMFAMLIIGEVMDVDRVASVRFVLLLGALFFLVSGTFFAFLRTVNFHGYHREKPAHRVEPEPGRPGPWRYVFTHRRVLALIAINTLIWSSAALVVTATFGVGKVFYELQGNDLLRFTTRLGPTLGAGMIVGAVVIGWVRTRHESPTVYLLGVALSGVMVTVFGLVPSLPVSYAATFLIGVFGNVAIVGVMSIIQSITPNWVRGRVMGLMAALSTTASVAVYLAVWRLPDADRNIIPVLWVLGPTLTASGVFGLMRYMTTGPMGGAFINFLWRIMRLYVLVWCRLGFTGKHRVPPEGAVILASNHLTGLDGFTMQAGINRPIRFLMIKDYELKAFWFLWKAIRPISLEHGTTPIKQVRQIVARLKQGEAVAIFPEGSLQREVRRLKPLQPGIVTIARLSGAPVVPVWQEGSPRVHGMLWHFLIPCRVHVTYGEPYRIDRSADEATALAELREKLMALGRRRAFDKHKELHEGREDQIEALFASGTDTDPTTGELIFDATPGAFEEGTFGSKRG
jgi:1-acyl-sn-glycerol-3-phosphate acyltransferase